MKKGGNDMKNRRRMQKKAMMVALRIKKRRVLGELVFRWMAARMIAARQNGEMFPF